LRAGKVSHDGSLKKVNKRNFFTFFYIEVSFSPGGDVMITIFCHFREKMAFFSKANVMITFLQKLAVV
jgi:hypothetical protein